MWKQYRYIPFYSSSKERLIETLQNLLDRKGFPQYPELRESISNPEGVTDVIGR